MKIKTNFTTNSSSCSFVICKSDLPVKDKALIIAYIKQEFNKTTISELIEDIDNGNPELYNLVEYKEYDDEMHIWIRRDEAMNDDYIDDILEFYDRSSNWQRDMLEDNKPVIKPKFDYHY